MTWGKRQTMTGFNCCALGMCWPIQKLLSGRRSVASRLRHRTMQKSSCHITRVLNTKGTSTTHLLIPDKSKTDFMNLAMTGLSNSWNEKGDQTLSALEYGMDL